MRIGKVKIIEMRVDEKVQRYKSDNVIATISSKFDIRNVGLLTVSLREDGFYYIIDGQHRMEAAMLNEVEELDCLIHEGLSIKDEANMFLALNKDRKLPTAIDNFKVAVTAGKELECAVDEILKKHNIVVDSKCTGISLGSPQTCIGIYNKYNGEVLDLTLEILLEAWGLGSIKSNPIRAMGCFIGDQREHVNVEELINRLSKACFATINQEVEKLKITKNFSRREALEVLIFQAYNKGRQNKLTKNSKVF